MNLQVVVHIFLVFLGVFVAINGTLGMFGFGLGESIIVLCILALLDHRLKRVYTRKSDDLR